MRGSGKRSRGCMLLLRGLREWLAGKWWFVLYIFHVVTQGP